MRTLVAFDKFKHALSAADACRVAAGSLGTGRQADLCPLTDGGEGFSAILTAAAGGRTIPQTVTGPRGAPVPASYGLVPWSRIPTAARALLGLNDDCEQVAVIEMAGASGIALLPAAQRDPWQTTSKGTGELIRHAAGQGADAILLGVGGSATNDLGLGALGALGLEFLDSAGTAIPCPIPARWPEITHLRGTVSPALPPIRIACDVTNPLLGPQGATAIYGPQKGLLAGDQARLEGECDRLSALLCAHMERSLDLRTHPGAGAAGGIAFGLQCAAQARLLPGFDFVSAWFDLDQRLATADRVITGEGRFDDSSLSGKGPGAIIRRALALGKETHVFAGQIEVTAAPSGLHLHAITPTGTGLDEALSATATNLSAAVRRNLAPQ